MPNTTERRSNTAPWWGLLLAVCAIGCNAAFFVNAPLQRIFPWLSLLFAVTALVFLALGLKRALGGRIAYRGKTLSVALGAIAFLLVAFAMFMFVVTRKLPSADAAPQVGQKVPDFTLADTAGTPVSLDQLLASFPASAASLTASSPASSAASPSSASLHAPQAHAPKAVLLIFYRGYW